MYRKTGRSASGGSSTGEEESWSEPDYCPGNWNMTTRRRACANCVAWDTEPEPPVRTPHTVYVKSLYRIAGHY